MWYLYIHIYVTYFATRMELILKHLVGHSNGGTRKFFWKDFNPFSEESKVVTPHVVLWNDTMQLHKVHYTVTDQPYDTNRPTFMYVSMQWSFDNMFIKLFCCSACSWLVPQLEWKSNASSPCVLLYDIRFWPESTWFWWLNKLALMSHLKISSETGKF